jgi:hypothetical protein
MIRISALLANDLAQDPIQVVLVEPLRLAERAQEPLGRIPAIDS